MNEEDLRIHLREEHCVRTSEKDLQVLRQIHDDAHRSEGT